jgi:hypothetical protein
VEREDRQARVERTAAKDELGLRVKGARRREKLVLEETAPYLL